MLALFVARLETPTRPLILSVSFIALGTALASAGEVRRSLRLLPPGLGRGCCCRGWGRLPQLDCCRALLLAPRSRACRRSPALRPAPPRVPLRALPLPTQVNLSVAGVCIMFLSELFESIRLVRC